LSTIHLTQSAQPTLKGSKTMTATTSPSVLIRAARGSDGPALEALAALDSATVPAGSLLVAEADGKVVAALSETTGARVADPFRHTRDVIELLELRASRSHGGRAHRRRGLRLAPRARLA
jgi:transposase